MNKEIKIYVGTDIDGTKMYWNPCNKSKEYHKKSGEIVVVLATSPQYRTPININ